MCYSNYHCTTKPPYINETSTCETCDIDILKFFKFLYRLINSCIACSTPKIFVKFETLEIETNGEKLKMFRSLFLFATLLTLLLHVMLEPKFLFLLHILYTLRFLSLTMIMTSSKENFDKPKYFHLGVICLFQ